jgi:putative mRNA 3-end processing factor
MAALLELGPAGLYCAAGDFYVDPWRPVERALITHAHADHARPGHRRYLCAEPGLELLRLRVQGSNAAAGVSPSAELSGLPYGRRLRIGGATVSFHPSGHLLGAAQIRIEVGGEVWVAGGDYKLAWDPSADPFEPLACHTFISESTFGLPIYRWAPDGELFDGLLAWWREAKAAGRTAVLYAYALGKAQRILARLAERLDDLPGPIGVHGAIARLLPPYEAAGIPLAPCLPASADNAPALAGRGLLLAPPAVQGTPYLRKFGPLSEALASGWMTQRGQRRRRGLERGFALSDHADWPGLWAAVRATGAQRVLVTHGTVEPFVRALREAGFDAAPLAAPYGQEEPDGAFEPGAEAAAAPDAEAPRGPREDAIAGPGPERSPAADAPGADRGSRREAQA